MSSSLVWRPKKHRGTLPYALKQKIEGILPRTFSSGDVQYLQGLADCDIDGAKKLIQLIEKHGEIEVSLEW